MTDKPNDQELKETIAALQKKNTDLQQQVSRLADSEAELSQVLAHVPLMIMIVDHQRRVRKVSNSTLQHDGQSVDSVIGLQGGDLLRCVHHLEDERGCGFGAACQHCVFRQTILDTLHTGKNHHKVEIQMSFLDNWPEERNLLVSTALLENRDRDAIVFVEDISRQREAEKQQHALIQQLQKALASVKKLHGLLPICANCKKIRDDKGYWKQIESYITDHSEAVFSHGICPDCIKTLYPKSKDRR